jgi:hypothetical protein
VSGCALGEWTAKILGKGDAQEPRTVRILGRVRIGLSSADIFKKKDGELTPFSSTQPLTGGNYLSAFSDVPNVGPIYPIESLSGIVPLAGYDTSSESAYRVTSVGSEQMVFVELIHPATGTRADLVRADAEGKFSLDFAYSKLRRTFVIQAFLVSQQKLTGYLASPLVVEANFKAEQTQDLSPGSTVVVWAGTILSGAKKEFESNTGFRSFKAKEWEELFSLTSSKSVEEGAKAIDSLSEIKSAASLDTMLVNLASASYELGAAAASTSLKVSPKLGSLAAAFDKILDKLASPAPDTKGSLIKLIPAAAGQVTEADLTEGLSKVTERAAAATLSALVDIPLPAAAGSSPATPVPVISEN